MWPAHQRLRTVAILLVLTIAAGACATRTVGQVLADPGQYRDRDVTLEGTVTESYSLLGRGVYRFEDGTGDLWVYATQGVPREGAQVRVQGTIRDAFGLGSIEGVLNLPDAVQSRISSGLLMVESDRRAR
jgi:hypothetical protein